MKKRYTPVMALLFVLLFSLTAWSSPGDMAQVLVDAHKNNQMLPILSRTAPEMTAAQAYQVQKQYVSERLRGDSIAGYKAGLTTPGAQKKFGVDDSVAGVLYLSGKKSGSPLILSEAFAMPMIETEIAYYVTKPITRKVNSVSELKRHIGAVLPSIELPDLNFADLKSLKGVDLIAGNVSATQFIVGNKKNKSLDLDSVEVVLTRNGEIVNQGKGADAMGSQWSAALWLVNTMVEQGWTIKRGNVLMTGALGNMIPGKPGRYRADFGALGMIEFEIR
jgi:2-keto-4-pentenoate hydratase